MLYSSLIKEENDGKRCKTVHCRTEANPVSGLAAKYSFRYMKLKTETDNCKKWLGADFIASHGDTQNQLQIPLAPCLACTPVINISVREENI